MSIVNIFLLVSLLVTLAGCGRAPVGPLPPAGIPFDLLIPDNRPVGDYYAASGIISRLEKVKIGDSIVESSLSKFYAQFHTAADSVALPTRVLLNENQLDRNRGGDTLRLATASSNDVLDKNAWVLIGSDSSRIQFNVPAIDPVDSVTPFAISSNRTFRSDTSFTISWTRPLKISGGMYIHWKAPGFTFTRSVEDFLGSYTVPADIIQKLRGNGRLTLIRFYNQTATYQGKRIVLSRFAQQSFDLSIQ